MAFFLTEILQRFSELARTRGDLVFAERCETEAVRLRENIEQHAWDGEVTIGSSSKSSWSWP